MQPPQPRPPSAATSALASWIGARRGRRLLELSNIASAWAKPGSWALATEEQDDLPPPLNQERIATADERLRRHGRRLRVSQAPAAEEQDDPTSLRRPDPIGLGHCTEGERDGHGRRGAKLLRQIPNITNLGLTPRRIQKAAIVGGGLMGSGIATALISNNFLVVLKEVNERFLDAGINRVKANLRSFVKKGQMTKEDYEKRLSLLSGVLDYEQFRDADVVIEAVIEDIWLKQQIFSDLERYCHSNCIFATNTSTIDLQLIGQKTACQDRIVGAHFFSPAHVMPLLEIVRTHLTSSQVIVDLLDVTKKIRKTPIVVGNCTGFAVNRMFFPYGQVAGLLVDYGLDVYHIDHAITQFGMPMGPFRLADLVGFAVAVATRKQYYQSYPERCYKSMLIQIMLEENRTGESSQRGFYLYDDKRKASPDPDIKKYIEKSRNMAGVAQDPKLMKLTDNDIVEMVFFPVVNEACRVLDEGIALKASDLDVASIMGMAFPSYRGGVMFWADSLGAEYVYNRLEAWSKDYGEFFRPCEYLAVRARQGASLASMVDDAKSRL